MVLIGLAATFGCSRSGGGRGSEAARCDTVFIERVRVDTVVVRDTVVERKIMKNTPRGSRPDTMVLHGDTFIVLKVLPGEFYENVSLSGVTLDSAGTQDELMMSLARGYIYPDLVRWAFGRPYTRTPEDMSDLPYLINMYTSGKTLPKYCIEFHWGNRLTDLATGYIDDERLFEMISYICMRQMRFRLERSEKQRKTLKDDIAGHRYDIDSLRVRVVAHNDRNALDLLERYYKDKNNDKGIAIYYKVMLSHDGNGDLAERFYRVLEPYFKETPEFRIAVREVLLRAALCDHNARAQELCDSLGYSLCDYKLPKIE